MSQGFFATLKLKMTDKKAFESRDAARMTGSGYFELLHSRTPRTRPWTTGCRRRRSGTVYPSDLSPDYYFFGIQSHLKYSHLQHRAEIFLDTFSGHPFCRRHKVAPTFRTREARHARASCVGWREPFRKRRKESALSPLPTLLATLTLARMFARGKTSERLKFSAAPDRTASIRRNRS